MVVQNISEHLHLNKLNYNHFNSFFFIAHETFHLRGKKTHAFLFVSFNPTFLY